MSEHVCWECGNPGRADEMRYLGDNLVHKTGCPQKQAGWAKCDHCEHAIGPADQVPYVELWAIKWLDETEGDHRFYGPKFHPAHVALPPRYVLREAGASGLDGIPEGAAGVAEWEPLVIEEDEYGPETIRPKVYCRECADRFDWPPLQGTKTIGSGQGRRAGTTNEDRWAMVTDEEPGITVPDALKLWGVSDTKGRAILGAGERTGALLVTEIPNPSGGGKPRKLYRRAVS
jgi:hypothetical protein